MTGNDQRKGGGMVSDGRPLRVDAQRNRARVVEAADELFAAEGLSVSVAQIARRAGVGTGTVSRHFPTKELLFEAILQQRMDALVAKADDLLTQADPGAGFFEFFDATVKVGGSSRGFAERLASVAADSRTLTDRMSADVLCERLDQLLRRAQASGTVRRDVDLLDVEALLVACMSRPPSPSPITDAVLRGLTAKR